MDDTKEPVWVRVASVSEIGVGEVAGVTVGNRSIALYRLDDGLICATDDLCTHGSACLSDGWLEGGVVECPLHGGRFEVSTGKGLGPPIEADLKTYPVRVDETGIHVAVPQQASGLG